MASNTGPEWRQQVEAILREAFGEDKFGEQLKRAEEFIDLAETVELPTGDMKKIIFILLKQASEEISPLAAAYATFRLGVAWERLQNANRA